MIIFLTDGEPNDAASDIMHADDKNQERRAEQCSCNNDIWNAKELANPPRYC